MPPVTEEALGRTKDGRAIHGFTVANGRGLVLRMMDFGATVLSLETPDRDGRRANLTLGLASLADSPTPTAYFGSSVGRTVNRIANARFVLDGETFALQANDGRHHLHGGPGGFSGVPWQAAAFDDGDEAGVEFRLVSPHGDGGYPGEVAVTARYALNDRDELRIVFTATSDRPTPVDLTNHCYWNLAGVGSGSIRDHVLELAADHFLPVDAELIPTGEIAPVAGTPMDFTRPLAIGARLDEVGNDPRGYDHCYVLRDRGGALRLAARVREPRSGRVMEVLTTQPGLQFYTGNALDGSARVNGHAKWSGFCLETQHFPDSVHQPHFPTTILRPGRTCRQETVHRFGVG